MDIARLVKFIAEGVQKPFTKLTTHKTFVSRNGDECDFSSKIKRIMSANASGEAADN